MAHHLSIIDSRTDKTYTIPIKNNAIEATDFLRIDDEAQLGEGLRVVDIGFRNTAVVKTGITKMDTKKGTLSHRGKDVVELSETCEYDEIAYLLIYGHLPTAAERHAFSLSVATKMNPPDHVRLVVESFPTTAPTFMILTAALAAWNGSQPNSVPAHAGSNLYMTPTAQQVDFDISRTLAATLTSVALTFCHKRGTVMRPPLMNHSMAYNLLLACDLVNDYTDQPDPEHVSILNKLWAFYVDNGMTNSTASFLCTASTLADPISSLISMLGSLYGPLHGGALDMAYKQFAGIGTPEKVPTFLKQVKKNKTRIFGFGHRVWKVTDPRYPHVRALLDSPALRERIQGNAPLAVAMEVERLVLQDEYFVKRGIRPNVDLIGAFVFTALGFGEDMALSIAVNARLAGLLANWREQLQQPVAIWRPQSIYIESGDQMQGAKTYRARL